MIIGIDGNEANTSRRVGIGEYAYEILSQISKFKPQNDNVKFQIYLKNIPLNDMPKESSEWHYKVIGPKKFWTQVGLPFHLYTAKPKLDIFFSPSHYAPRFSPVPTAISVMDVSYIHFPEMFTKRDLYQLKNWTKYSVKNAKKIFTISNSSKNDIIKHYEVLPEKVVVTYPGVKEISNFKFQISNMKELHKKFGISDQYILFVGTLQPRKNIVRLIEAFAKILREKDTKILSARNKKSPNILVSQYPNLSLVIVGKKGWQYEEILAAPEKFGIKDSVNFLDFVTNEDLPSLYKNAICYVLPSLYEGFGLPVLEAMQYDCPVITSNVSSMPEAGGDAALYVNPTDVNDIAEKIEKLIVNEKLRQELIAKGRKQIKKFSWEKTARETLEVLEALAKA